MLDTIVLLLWALNTDEAMIDTKFGFAYERENRKMMFRAVELMWLSWIDGCIGHIKDDNIILVIL